MVSRITDHDIYLFNEGTHYRIYEKLGAHPETVDGVEGTYFAVWAPNAERVFLTGDFNNWSPTAQPLAARANSGIWEAFIPGIRQGTHYKYHIESKHNGYKVDKTDPFGFYSEVAPANGSIVWELGYEWADAEWMKNRHQKNALDAPISIYEMHLGSWMHVPEENNRSLTYRELAPKLAQYLKELGFTHVEFLPLMEHPFYGSWGYQVTGFFAATSRYGTPQDLMYLIDHLHQNGIGVILDWVPSHFPTDEHGLGYFDGTHLFEHAHSQQGFHPDWASYIFNYGRHEIRSFLTSSALFWLDRYHVDGLRVDGVASMLYLDYSRKEGEWIPNKFGGKENLDAIEFLQKLNHEVYQEFPDVQMIAEESTAWANVSRPTYIGGLGFGMKWDMGWMHDMLQYMSREPVHRQFHHNDLTFRMLYAFTENFILAISHDEVVHGKASLLSKMPGDQWQRFANLRLLLAYMYAQSGKKLLFMGSEFGQWREWNHEESLDWHLHRYPMHGGLKHFVSDLNQLYKSEPALYQLDFDHAGFEWIDHNDRDQSVISFIRKAKSNADVVLAAFNFTPVPRVEYRIGLPRKGFWKEILNSDAEDYAGSGYGNLGGGEAVPIPIHGRPYSINLTLPPLGAVFLKNEMPRS